MALDTNERTRLKTAGLSLVREKHSMSAREPIFLSNLRQRLPRTIMGVLERLVPVAEQDVLAQQASL